VSSIDLFRIVMGTRVWTLTSAEKRQTYNAGEGVERYDPVAIDRGETVQKNSLAKADLDVTLPLDHSLSQFLLSSFYDQVITLTLFNNDDGDVSVAWKGRLASTKPDNQQLTLSFESIFTSLRRPGLRARYQRSCRHALYHRGCNLDPEDFAVAATLDAITGTLFTVPEVADHVAGYFRGGMVRAGDGPLAYIADQIGTQLSIQRVPPAFTDQFATEGAGTAITLYPGCDHARMTCKGKFNNVLNYGGFDWIPQKNPMGGSSIV
jgi:uncharacterized phage protein (TIGR02218 family)